MLEAAKRAVELANLIDLGLAVTATALAREESRGTYYRGIGIRKTQDGLDAESPRPRPRLM